MEHISSFTHIIDFLIENGININQPAINNKTALLIAAARGNIALISYLINHGANWKYCNINNKTCYTTLCEFNHLDGVKYMERYYKISNEEHEIGLIYSIMNNDYKMMKYLLFYVKDIDEININNLSLKIYAELMGLKKITKSINFISKMNFQKDIIYNELPEKECLLSAKEIKTGDKVLMCEYNHIYLMDEFSKWYKTKMENECIYCKNQLINNFYYNVK